MTTNGLQVYEGFEFKNIKFMIPTEVEIKTAAAKWMAETGNHHDAESFERGAMFVLQNFCKPDVVRCKELLEQKLTKETDACKEHRNDSDYKWHKHIRNANNLREVIKMLEEHPAL